MVVKDEKKGWEKKGEKKKEIGEKLRKPKREKCDPKKSKPILPKEKLYSRKKMNQLLQVEKSGKNGQKKRFMKMLM